MGTNTAEYMARWYSEHKEERRAYMHAYYLENRHRWAKPRVERDYRDCAYCGNPFYPLAHNGKYCSVRCRNRARYERMCGNAC